MLHARINRNQAKGKEFMIKPLLNGNFEYISKMTGTKVTNVYHKGELISRTVVPKARIKSWNNSDANVVSMVGTFLRGKAKTFVQKTTSPDADVTMVKNIKGEWLVY